MGTNFYLATTSKETRDKYFGYDYLADEMTSLRELFKYAQTVYFYRLNNNPVK